MLAIQKINKSENANILKMLSLNKQEVFGIHQNKLCCVNDNAHITEIWS